MNVNIMITRWKQRIKTNVFSHFSSYLIYSIFNFERILLFSKNRPGAYFKNIEFFYLYLPPRRSLERDAYTIIFDLRWRGAVWEERFLERGAKKRECVLYQISHPISSQTYVNDQSICCIKLMFNHSSKDVQLG